MADGANHRREGLLVDWGGVMTSNLFDSFSAFLTAEGIEADALASAFRRDRSARDALIAFEEGRIHESEFQTRLAALLGVRSPERLIERLMAGAQLDERMVQAVRAARTAGVHTGMISNSWGVNNYPRPLLAELFEGVVISGELGMRKPAPRMYELGAESIGLAPAGCVFVDDLSFNLEPARELGMATVLHTSAAQTIAELQPLLGVVL